MFFDWIPFLKRSPRVGDRKDLVMSETNEPAPAPPDVARQISELTDAVNKLVAAQQSAAQSIASRDIGGSIPGGEALLPGVDYSRLSPLQQITLGLRDVKPIGPARKAVVHERAEESRGDDAGDGLSGAD
jgi:hypothetical protein